MRTPSISGDVPQPSRLELLAGLLRFFTAPAEDQLRLLEEYTSLCEKDGGVPPHVDDPFVELAGGLWSCCRTCGTGPSFGITGPPEEVELLVRELASLVSLMLGSQETADDTAHDHLWSPEGVRNAAAWRLVRRLSRVALEAGATYFPTTQMPLFDLMCYVAD